MIAIDPRSQKRFSDRRRTVAHYKRRLQSKR
jgi:hypothetical protein